jgi:hypothetical protein
MIKVVNIDKYFETERVHSFYSLLFKILVIPSFLHTFPYILFIMYIDIVYI